MMRKTVLSGWFPVVVTVRLAALLVTLPAALLTTTVNWSPLSAAVVAGGVWRAGVAPPMPLPLFCRLQPRGGVARAASAEAAVWPTPNDLRPAWCGVVGATWP